MPPGFEGGHDLARSRAPTARSCCGSRREQARSRSSSLEVTLPPGLTGKLAGVARCSGRPDRGRRGARANRHAGAGEPRRAPAARKSAPSTSPRARARCRSTSTGHAYLAGPYEGAPVLDRDHHPGGRRSLRPRRRGRALGALHQPVDRPGDGQIRPDPDDPRRHPARRAARSSSSIEPHALHAQPDQLRTDVCSAARVASALGATAPLSDPFQVGGCAGLPFKPGFSAHDQRADEQGRTARRSRVKVTQPEGEAEHPQGASCSCPSELPSRLTTIQKACTEQQFASKPEAAGCPEASRDRLGQGHHAALDAPLEGPGLPGLPRQRGVPRRRVPAPRRRTCTSSSRAHRHQKGAARASPTRASKRFPTQPISSFEAVLPQGPHSALGAVGDLCAQPLIAPTTLTAQNGRGASNRARRSRSPAAPSRRSR